MDKTSKSLKAAGKTRSFYSAYEKKKVDAETLEIVERAKGPWLAKGKDRQGRPLRQFVARGTRLEKK